MDCALVTHVFQAGVFLSKAGIAGGHWVFGALSLEVVESVRKILARIYLTTP
jgi:hypothetical protein